MTQPQLFVALFASCLFCINGAAEIRNRNFAFGALMIAVPLCGWVSIWAKP